MKILVAGAGGMLGKEIIKSLNQRGVIPDGLAYSDGEFEQIKSPLGRKICGDVTKPRQIAGICKDIDVVISTLGITRLHTKITHMDVDFQGNVNLLNEAKNAGVKKFVFISPAGTDQGCREVPLFEAKYLFEQELKKGGIDWLIFRSGGFYKDLADYGKTGAKGKSYVINGGINRSTPIDVTDLAEIMTEDTLTKQNQIIDVGGPEDLSWIDICQICTQALNAKTRIASVPGWLCRALLWLIRPFSHKYYAMGKLLLYTSTHDLLTSKRGKLKFSDYVKKYYNCNGCG